MKKLRHWYFLYMSSIIVYVCCRSELYFYKFADKQKLSGTVIRETDVAYIQKCFSYCLYEESCKSVNIQRLQQGRYTCYLMSETRCTAGVISATNFSFYDTQRVCLFQLRLLGGSQQCIKNLNSQLVIDSCDVTSNFLFTFTKDRKWMNGNFCVYTKDYIDTNDAELMLNRDCQQAPSFKMIGSESSFYIQHVEFLKCVHVDGGGAFIDTVNRSLVVHTFCGDTPQSTLELIYP